MRRLLATALGLGAISVALVSCANDEPVQRADGITLMVATSEPTAVMDALIVGTLTITDSGCFALIAGETTYPLQFPYGTRLGADGNTVTVPGLPPLREGNAIRGGGGYLNLIDPPPSCSAANEFDEYAIWQTVISD